MGFGQHHRWPPCYWRRNWSFWPWRGIFHMYHLWLHIHGCERNSVSSSWKVERDEGHRNLGWSLHLDCQKALDEATPWFYFSFVKSISAKSTDDWLKQIIDVIYRCLLLLVNALTSSHIQWMGTCRADQEYNFNCYKHISYYIKLECQRGVWGEDRIE